MVVSSAGNLESVLSGLARAGIDPAGFEAVFSIHELPLVTAAALAQLAGRPVLPVGSAVALSFRLAPVESTGQCLGCTPWAEE